MNRIAVAADGTDVVCLGAFLAATRRSLVHNDPGQGRALADWVIVTNPRGAERFTGSRRISLRFYIVSK